MIRNTFSFRNCLKKRSLKTLKVIVEAGIIEFNKRKDNPCYLEAELKLKPEYERDIVDVKTRLQSMNEALICMADLLNKFSKEINEFRSKKGE